MDECVPIPINDVRNKKFLSAQNGFVHLHEEYDHVTAYSPMFAIDCEMVLTSAGSELARISLIDESNCCFLDKLVLPHNPVLDYITRYSGITRRMLESIETRLEDIHDDLRRLLPKDAILVGHSIQNDLKALKLYHPYIIDTSVIYNLTMCRRGKPKLKLLANYFVGKTIQGSQAGHSSNEDAKVTMDLVRLKLSQSLEFGDVCTGWRFPKETNPLLPIDFDGEEQSDSLLKDYPSLRSLFQADLNISPLVKSHAGLLKNSYRQTPFCTGGFSNLFTNLLTNSGIPNVLWPQFPNLAYSEPVIDGSTNKKFVGTASKENADHLAQLTKSNRVILAQIKPSSQAEADKFVERLTKRSKTNSILFFITRGSLEPAREIQFSKLYLGLIKEKKSSG
ncbi:hypothetical protein Ciccas_001240 [Cichlidogyrus casuarinus]|uniref:Exonuclease domain-containing protein n=1 Tax=Cichlidogyrus casuarinus TaxID=1844966 RepID=A0ABD2QMW5_9PLAT